MRPLKLEMEGFSTFRDRVEVDFTDIDVVALVGPTGSGKSTIIDAITFALYGSVARYDDRGIVAPVINQLSAEAKVRLDFVAGGDTYTAVRIVRRTKTGASTKEARLECDGQVLAGDPRGLDAAIRDLLGLDFERFNKTVVLPQGKFATFLHDKPADRQQLLRELLGLGVYERLGRQARQQAAVADNQLSILEPQLATLEDLSEQRLAVLYDTLERAEIVREHLANAATQATALTTDLAEADQAGERLQAAQRLLVDVRIPEGISLLAEQIGAATTATERAETAMVTAREDRRGCERAAKDGPQVARCETLLGHYETAAELETLIATLDQTHRDAVGAHSLATARVEQFRDRIGESRATLDRVRTDRDRAEAALAALPELAALESQLSDHQRRAEVAASVVGAQQVADASDQRCAVALVAAELANEHHHTLVQLAPASALTALLVVGAACPVCSQVVDHLPAVHDTAELITAAHEAAELTRQQHQRALADSTRAEAAVTASRDELSMLERRLTGAADLDETHRRLQLVRQGREQLGAAQQLATNAERDLRQIEDDPQLGAAMNELAETTSLLSGTAASLEAYAEQQGRLQITLQDAPDLATLATELAAAHQLVDDLDQAILAEAAAEQHLGRARSELATVSQHHMLARTEYARLRDWLGALKPEEPSGDLLQDWTTLSGWAVQQRRLNDATTIELEQRRQQIVQQLSAITDSAVAACAEFVTQPAADLHGLREQMATASQRLRSDMERFLERREHFVALTNQANDLRESREVATMLGNLLRSDGFEKWLLQEVLADLVGRATVRLKELSGGQFSLVANDGSFSICDHRNADEIRDARTLSGGETFLASLSLALALADASADLAVEGSAPLESIFLDEGFGTLDPDTLDIVATTLEELGASGRMVAVVTHIRELAERMPIRLEVAKGPLTSTVTRVEV